MGEIYLSATTTKNSFDRRGPPDPFVGSSKHCLCLGSVTDRLNFTQSLIQLKNLLLFKFCTSALKSMKGSVPLDLRLSERESGRNH